LVIAHEPAIGALARCVVGVNSLLARLFGALNQR